MTVCQFFLRGQCKFGSNCRNEHPSGGIGKSVSFGGLTKSSFGSSGTNSISKWQGNDKDSVEKIILNIKNEMLLWEKSKMWLFSCFSYQKETPSMSGLVDQSPEEIRLAAYDAKEKGTTSEYLNNIKQLDTQFMTRRAELKTLSSASWEQEVRKMSGEASSSSGLFQRQSSTNNPFSGSSGLFSNQNSTSNPFATTTTKQSLFGSSTEQPLFGSNQSSLGKTNGGSSQSSLFGSTQQSAFGSGQQSAFGSGNQQSLFSLNSNFGNQTKGSLFGSSLGGQKGLFSQVQQQSFGSSTNHVQENANVGLFSQAPSISQQQQQLQQQQPSNSLFTQQNLFGQNNQQQSSIFGQQSTGMFSTHPNGASSSSQLTQQSQPGTTASQNPFFQAMQQKQAPVAPAVADTPSTLKMTEKDLEAFKADKFILGQIPECPPPPELC